MHAVTIDSRRELLVGNSDEETRAFCSQQFLTKAKEAIALRGCFAVALSGGSTPKQFYNHLTSLPEAHFLDWSRVKLFVSDERAVSASHPDSNFGMCMHYFNKEPFSLAKAYPMHAEREDLPQAARDYEQLIKQHCPEGRFDLVYLGIGEDGHTASLFPDTAALTEQRALVAANYVPEKKSWRMTLTFSCINNARLIVVLAIGASKAAIIQQACEKNTSRLPIHRVGTDKSPALFICDRQAASNIV